MGEDKNAPWYGNKDLFEMIQEYTKELVKTREEFTKELTQTRNDMRKYNGLRKDIDDMCIRLNKYETKQEEQDKAISNVVSALDKLSASFKSMSNVGKAVVTMILVAVVTAVLKTIGL